MTAFRALLRVPVRMGPDWSNLPSDVVQVISEKIIFKKQYVPLRLVCQQWRRICPPHPHHLIDQVPWLFFLPYNASSSTLFFYDFSQSKTYNFDLPDVIDKRICGYSRGWLLLEKDMKLSLINPITREMKSNCLPSLATTPRILDFAGNEQIFNPLIFVDRHITEIILASSPTDEDCIVVASFSLAWELGFCRVGDNSWTILKLTDYDRDSCVILDFKYKNGLLYAIDNKGQLTVYDLQNLSQKIIIDNLSSVGRNDHLYLVIGEGEFDGIPLVVRGFGYEKYEVYKCVNEREQSEWRRVRNIGNAVLIVGNGQGEMVSLNNVQLNEWEGNHICYCTKSEELSSCNINIKMTSIENGSFKEVPITSLGLFSLGYDFPWFMPRLD